MLRPTRYQASIKYSCNSTGIIKDRVEPRTVEYYWLGLTDIETEGEFEWIDHIQSAADFRLVPF